MGDPIRILTASIPNKRTGLEKNRIVIAAQRSKARLNCTIYYSVFLRSMVEV